MYAGKQFLNNLTCDINSKGVLTIDSVKGCSQGLSKNKNGCYGLCYAASIAKSKGFDFSKSISRNNIDKKHIEKTLYRAKRKYYRNGVMGDPSHDWELTLYLCEWLRLSYISIIVTKHWHEIPDKYLNRFKSSNAVFNTSISALDNDDEIEYRLYQYNRIKRQGITSILRIVSCNFGDTEYGNRCNIIQKKLFKNSNIIDNPLRINKNNKLVLRGDVLIDKVIDLNKERYISRKDNNSYVGSCDKCRDKCGLIYFSVGNKMKEQISLFEQKVEYRYLKQVIGSGFENQVAELAIIDGIAKRAARKNMQIHSAIVLILNDEFSGFFTFQNNDACKEFCLLQSVIYPEKYSDKLYYDMVLAVLEQNKNNYPALITTDPKSKFETPALFKSIGFVTYLKMSGFEYMVYGDLKDIRMKILSHITMTNVWNSIKGDWLRLKNEWNDKIEESGRINNISNPAYATRAGCWQGESGFSNIVLTERKIENGAIVVNSEKSHNGNASVLDPVACEIILRFFIPKDGKRVYNPFGGGVQFGFIAGYYGYEYIASEIRQNQCDANNRLCSGFNAKWIKSDSSSYEPDGMFDLVFTCPPYYRVEKYIDYNGEIPCGEINSLSSYDEFRDTLFKGYKIAINHLNDNCFFVVMTGDSRDSKGSYHCHESETEIFFKENGLSVYNKIVYLECEFTRLAQAKKTLDHRKFPKREQKIIVAFKGDNKKIKELYQPIGRL